MCAAPDTDDWQDCVKGDQVGFVKTACSTTAGETIDRAVKCVVSRYDPTTSATVYEDVMSWFCDAANQPETSTGSDCTLWSPVNSTCVWDGKSCYGGTITTTYECLAGDGMCAGDKPDNINIPCTLAVSQCHFSYVCVPDDTTNASMITVNDKSCDNNNHFVPADERHCYKDKQFTRRRVCYDADLDIISADEDTDCGTDKPTETVTLTNEDACTCKSYCAATGHSDFTNAATAAGVTECAADDATTAMSACSVVCDRAERTRAVKCVSEVGTPVEDAKCDVMPASTVACTTAPVVSGLTMQVVADASGSGTQALVVGSLVKVSWCYYAGDLSSAPVALLTLSSASDVFPAVRLAQVSLSAGSVEVTLPVMSSASDAVFSLVSSLATLETSSAVLQSKCVANASYCGAHGTCDAQQSLCTCKDGYTGARCDVTPCAAAQCHVERTQSCANDGVDAGVCVCQPGFGGARCEAPVACDSSSCSHGGFVDQTNGSCDAACTCTKNWTDAQCSTCSLSCTATANGQPDSDCSKCVCNAGYAGATCSLRQVYGTLVFVNAPASMLSDPVWLASLQADLALVLGVRVDAITVVSPHSTTGKVGVLLTSTAEGPDANQLSALSALWTKVVDNMRKVDGVLNTGAFVTTVTANPDVKVYTVHDVYDPACVGVSCMVGVNPYDPSPYVPPCGEPGNECAFQWQCRVWNADGTYTHRSCANIEQVCEPVNATQAASQCYTGKLKQEVYCVDQTGGVDATQCVDKPLPQSSCVVTAGCQYEWLCRETADSVAVSCVAANGSNGFSSRICTDDVATQTEQRDVTCYMFLEGVLVESLESHCVSAPKPEPARALPLCAPWTAVNSTCEWDQKTCYGGTLTTTYDCPAGEGECTGDQPAALTNVPCSLAVSQCNFNYICVPTGTADEDIAGITDKSCDNNNHFVSTSERLCFKDKDFTRRRVCYDATLNIVSANEDSDCSLRKPEETVALTEEADCTYKPYCAATGHLDFSNAATAAGVMECLAGDIDTAMSPCTIVDKRAERTRAVKCVSEVGTPVEDVKCGAMPVAVVPCMPITNLTVTPVDGAFVVEKRILISWEYSAVEATTAPEALFSLTSASNAFLPVRLTRALLAATSVEATLPIVSSADDATITMVTSFATLRTSAFLMQSKCRADSAYCGTNGTCIDKFSECTCLNGYTGNNCEISPCAKAGCHSTQSTCQNTGPSAGVCVCKRGFEGTRCEKAVNCKISNCRNNGFLEDLGGVCSDTCTCVNKWQGRNCDACGLTCTATANGKADANCSGCVCNPGYEGPDCSCRTVKGSLHFPSTPPNKVADKTFQESMRYDILTVTQLPKESVKLYPYSSYVVVSFMNCSIVKKFYGSMFPQLTRFRVQEDMSSLYEKWNLVQEDLKKEDSILMSGAAMQEVIAAGGTAEVSEMYDPLCTGSGCPTGKDPLALPESGEPPSTANDSTLLLIAGIGIGVLVLAVGFAVFFFCRRKNVKVTDARTYATEDNCQIEMRAHDSCAAQVQRPNRTFDLHAAQNMA